jgi:hypothetical protein
MFQGLYFPKFCFCKLGVKLHFWGVKKKRGVERDFFYAMDKPP